MKTKRFTKLLTLTLLGGTIIAHPAHAGGWKPIPKNEFVPVLYRYDLKKNVRVGFDVNAVFIGNPIVTYFKNSIFGEQDSTGSWLSSDFSPVIGCLTDIVSNGDKLKSFVLKADVPDYVAKTMGYGKKPMQLIVQSDISLNSNEEEGVVKSEINLFDDENKKVETFHMETVAYPGLYDSAPQFLKANQCK